MRRALLFGSAIALLLVGIALNLRRCRPEPPPEPVTVLVAKTDIPTYTTVSREDVFTETRPSDTLTGPSLSFPETGELITKKAIQAGEALDDSTAVVVGGEWRPGTLDMEVLSFPADFDKMVAGQIRSGHRVNIYGYQPEENALFTPLVLVAENVWVVDARTGRGNEAERPTPDPQEEEDGRGALTLSRSSTEETAPASVITVAAGPNVIWRIIQALGTQDYKAWVTLAGPEHTPTPTPTNTPLPTATPTATSTPPPTNTPVVGEAEEGETEEELSEEGGATPVTPVIHVVLVNWLLEVVSPTDLQMNPTADNGYAFDYEGRELTLEVRNDEETRLWAKRQDQDPRAKVLIDGKDGMQVWLRPGEQGTISIRLVPGADEATVVLVDKDEEEMCLDARYVADVTIPDNTELSPDQPFEKVWRVRNDGACTWPANAEVAYFEGEQMDAPFGVDVGAVEPGEEIEVSVPMKAPSRPGTYRGKWRMKTPEGFFGGELWISIQVK
jgi:hypothetical protein